MIVHRAFYREASQTTAAIVVVLLVVLLLFGLTSALGRTVRGDYAESIVLRLLGWQTLRRFDLLLPLAFYLGVLLTFSRWYRDNEMAVLAACGVSLAQLLRPVFVLAIIVALLAGAASFYLNPLATRSIDELRAESSQRPELAGITPGIFSESAAGGRILYAERVDADGRMGGIFLHNPAAGRPRVIFARSGYPFLDEQTNQRLVTLLDGWAYEGTPGQADYQMMRFKKYTLRLNPKPIVPPPTTVEGLPTPRLFAMAGAEAASERQWRLSKPLLVFVLALYGMVLAYTDARRGRLGNLFAAILVYFIYSNLLGLAQTWLARGQLPTALGLWWVHVVMLAVAIFLFFRRSRHLPLLPRLGLARAS